MRKNPIKELNRDVFVNAGKEGGRKSWDSMTEEQKQAQIDRIQLARAKKMGTWVDRNIPKDVEIEHNIKRS